MSTDEAPESPPAPHERGRTLVALFPAPEKLLDAVAALDASDRVRIYTVSVVGLDAESAFERLTGHPHGPGPLPQTLTREAAGAGASAGAVVGAVAGLLAGLGVFILPGVGAVIAAGPIVSTFAGAGAGAAMGGATGALIGAGIPRDRAGHYTAAVQHGYILLAVTVDDYAAAAHILADFDPVDVDEAIRNPLDVSRGADRTEADAEAEPDEVSPVVPPIIVP